MAPPQSGDPAPQATASAISTASNASNTAAADAAEEMDETLATAAPTPEGQVVPTYRTAWAPATTLNYRVRRGAAEGQVQLDWRPSAEQGRYELALKSHSWVSAKGQPIKDPPMQWASRGQFDGAGLAPERFTVARRGRERHAANFQRDKGLVTYAGPAAQWPLAAGMQDRLSWMLQLGAILQAEPALAAVGQQVHLWVVGAHGDAAVWTFTVTRSSAVPEDAHAAAVAPALDGRGPLPPQAPVIEQTQVTAQATSATPLSESGALAPTAGTVMLQREATHPYDTQVQVWLDPAQHHRPVRVVFKQRASGQSTELWLRALQAP
jgi:hypothetical protein